MNVAPDEKDVICGDFNLDQLKPQIKNSCKHCLNAFSLKFQNNLKSIRPTLYSKRCLVVVYSNFSTVIQMSNTLITDHSTVVKYPKETKNEFLMKFP